MLTPVAPIPIYSQSGSVIFLWMSGVVLNRQFPELLYCVVQLYPSKHFLSSDSYHRETARISSRDAVACFSLKKTNQAQSKDSLRFVYLSYLKIY